MCIKSLIFLICFSISFTAFSQERSDLKVLQSFATAHRIKENDEYNRAIWMAKQKGWPLTRIGKNGTIFSLQRIDFLGNPIYYSTFNNTIAAATTRANQLWPGGSSGLNLSGASTAVSAKLGIWDGGVILKSHVEFATIGAGSRILQKDSATAKHDNDEHATHTSGTLVATGVNPIAKGMAFGMKQLIAYDYYNEFSEIASEASNLLISNHSYGIPGGWAYDGTNWSWNGDTTISRTESYYFGYYSNEARTYDTIAYAAPNYLMVFSAGNSNGNNGNGLGPAIGASYLYNGGTKVNRTTFLQNNPTYGSVAMGQTAKNILTVGAVSGLPNGYNTSSDVQIASFSSWGPTDDGRIKPDIVADGVGVTSTSNASTTSYATLDGTSMSSPNAAGSLLLLQEYYNQKHPGIFMRASTLKALAVHTADEAGPAAGPDYTYGYGLLDVLKASSVISSSFNQKTDTIIEKTLNSGLPYTASFIASGSGPIKATIVWTDPAATVITDNASILNNTSPRLVNDLDLRITGGGNTYYPWILNPASPTAPATKGDDKLNNIEVVQIDSVVPGKTYAITVSNKGSLLGGNQVFSLIASGIGGTAFCTSAGLSTTAGAAIDSVVMAGIANKNLSNAGYTDYTNLSGSIEPAQTIPITVSVRNRDASANPRIVSVFIDYNGNGIFEPSELVAQSAVINASTGKLNASIVSPLNLTIGNTLLMRVIVEETSNAASISSCGTYPVGETEDFRVKVVAPSHDIGLTQVLAPVLGGRYNASQLLSVSVRNLGTTAMSNIAFTATIKSGATLIANLSGVFPSTVSAGNNMIYTFQTPFNLDAATTYTISVIAKASGDQNATNDTLLQTITTAAKSLLTGVAEVCSSNTAFLKVNNPSTSKYFWYAAMPTATSSPLLVGSTGSTATIPTNNTYYLSTGARASVGPADKSVYGLGGYISASTPYNGGYTYDSAAVPLVIETAKIYANSPGQVKIAVHPGTKTSIYPSAGDSVIVDVYPNLDNNGNDLGNDYYLNLHLDNSISNAYYFSFNCLNGAAIFRNNAASVSYPLGAANIFQVTTAEASPASQYYYFLYNMKIATADSLSDPTPVVASSPAAPVITVVGNVLTSNIATGTNQWYLNGVTVSGTNTNYTATQSGSYTLANTDLLGCTKTSNAINVSINAIQNVSDTAIALTLSPNPNKGLFHIGFTLDTKANVGIELINASGVVCFAKSYPNFAGKFSEQFNVPNLAAGMYILKVQQDEKVYRKPLLIIR